MARALLASLSESTVTLRLSFSALRAQVPAVSGNREQRRAQARELRRRVEQTTNTSAALLEQVAQTVAERAAAETLERTRALVRASSAEALRQRLETRTVRRSIERAGGEAADRIERLLLLGVTRERTPEVVRDQVLAAIGGGAEPSGLESRVLVIARTELAAAERAGAFAAMEADGVGEWVWISRLGTTTCPYCWSMHGTLHKLGESMATHPCCLCRPVARLRGARHAQGTDLFAALEPDEQKRVLGPVAYEAYRTGLITLPDLRRTGVHPELGPVGGTASLTSLLTADVVRDLRLSALR